jgi:signal transduction histidine kinase
VTSPLRSVRSIKVKFSIVIVAAIAMAVLTSQVGYILGWPIWLRPILAAGMSLIVVPFLARGMTRPLRAMTSGAQSIAAGNYDQQICTTSVDEVGQLAAAFNAMANDLAEADRQRRDLVANVSHELRTPIAGIKATLENLVDGVSEPTPQLLTAMYGRIDRLHRLVEDLLDLSRFEAGTVELMISDVDLGQLVHSLVSESRLDHPQATVTVSIPDHMTVQADSERLGQVVVNLLENALRHGNGPVSIAASNTADDVELTIADGGPGIPVAQLDRVFERFYRADLARSTSGGVGLGLSIVRWIVELHGGRVSAANIGPPDQPVGAKFTVSLPIIR